MGTLWPARLGVGDRVRFAGWVHTITGLHGGVIELSDPYGAVRQVNLTALLCDGAFAVVDAVPAPSAGVALGVSGAAAQRARWWRHHIVEVVTGLPPEAGPGTVPRPPYDPAVFTLAEREAAKARELQRAGSMGMSARTVRRKRHRWQAEGLKGLVDGRSASRSRTAGAGGAAHPEVVEALRQVVADTREGSHSVAFYQRATARELEDKGVAAEKVMPSRAGFYRLYARATAAGVPAPAEQRLVVARWMRPGERVHVTTVALARADWLPGVPLAVTLAVDETSHSILDAVVYPARSRIDGAALVARMCTPAALRPRPGPGDGWGDVVRTAADTAAAGQAAVTRSGSPVVRPETLVLGSSVLAGMDTWRRACQELGISVRRASPYTPTATVFLEHIARDVVTEFADWLRPAAGCPVHQVQEMLETWVGEVWQNTPRVRRDGLPGGRGALTPNQAHAAAVAAAGWTAVPLSPGEFLRFLPHASRAVGPSGLRVNGRRYDSTALDPLRHRLADTPSQPRCVVHWDPYDVRCVFVNGPSDQWITVPMASDRGTGRTAPDTTSTSLPAQSVRVGGSVNGLVRRALPVTAGVAPAFRPGAVAALDLSLPAEQWRRLVAASPSLLNPDSRTATVPGSDADRVRYHASLLLPAAPVLSVVREVERLATLNRGASPAKRSLMLCGDPGTGKTTALVEVARAVEDEPHEPGRVRRDSSSRAASVYISVPPRATAPVLLSELLGFFGLPRPRSLTQYDLARRVLTALTEAGTQMVLMDDCHRLRATPASRFQTAELLAYLSGQARATFVFAGTGRRTSLAAALSPEPARPALLEAELTDLACDDQWHALVAATEERLVLRDHTPGTLPSLASYLHRLTGGSLDRLTYLVRSGAIHAIRTGREAITEADLATLSASWPHPPRAGSGI